MRRPNEDSNGPQDPVELEKIVIAIDGSVEGIEREAARLSISPNIDQVLNEVKEAELQGIRLPVIKSGIRAWAETRVGRPYPPPFRPICHGEINKVPLATRVKQITSEVINSDVLLIEAPTGAGKSVIMPTVMDYVARYAEYQRPPSFPAVLIGTSWKVIHVSPTSEQAVQNMEWVKHQHELHGSCIQFGVYTSAVGHSNGLMRKSAPTTANYVYATTFYGEQASALGGILHAVVIDDVHEWTPETIKLLCLIRQELCRGKQYRNIFKLILLSATLSIPNRQTLFNYFDQIEDLVVRRISMGEKPFTNHLVLSDDDRLMKAAMQGRMQSHLYANEEDASGGPHIQVLTSRSVAVQEEIIKEVGSHLCPGLPNPPGIIAFHPGRYEAGRARAKLIASPTFKKLIQTNLHEIVVYKVAGSDRADLEVLMEPYNDGDPMRVIHSTPLLSYGVTLPGIYFVIDDGTMKLPGSYNHTGVVKLITRFEDRNMLIQKRGKIYLYVGQLSLGKNATTCCTEVMRERSGRVSRVAPGAFLIVVSRRRYEEILKTDHTLVRLDRAFRTNHVPFLLEHRRSLMVSPDDATMNELVIDMRNTGMVGGDGMPTAYAKLLGSTFAGLSLALSDFVVRCCAFGIGLHGVVFAASCCTEHRAIRRPSGDGAGRDDRELPMNRWPDMTGDQQHSDIEQVTEMALNFLLARPAVNIIPSFCRNVVHAYSKVLEDKDVVDDLFRRVVTIFNSLRALGCAPSDIKLFFKENLEDSYNICGNKCDRGTIFRLKRRQRNYFNVCLLSSLGSRILYEAREKDQDSRRTNRRMFVLGDELTSSTVLVQGERAWNSGRSLAVFDVVVRRVSHEHFLTGFLHYVSMMDYALYGNTSGSTRDEVNLDKKTLKINTNTSSVFVDFADVRTLWSVIRTRKIMRAVSIAAVMRGEGYEGFVEEVKKMVDNLSVGANGQIRWKLGGFDGNNFSAVSSDGIDPAAGKNDGTSFHGIPMKKTRGMWTIWRSQKPAG